MGRKARIKAMRKDIKNSSKSLSSIDDDWMNIDREYFKLHPGRKEYTRLPTVKEKNEFSGLEPKKDLVKIKVVQVGKGVRIREPIFEDIK